MKLEALRELYGACQTGADTAAMRVNRESRFCEWKGQSADGRKWKKRLGDEPVPFDGCADTRPALVDLYLGEDKDFLCAITGEAQIGALPTEPTDAEKANRATALLRWMIYEQTPDLGDEQELAADYFLGNGKAVAGVFWRQQRRLERRTVTMDAVVAAAAEVQPEEAGPLARLPELILNPALEETAALVLREVLGEEGPDTDAGARKLVRALRTKGAGEYARSTITDQGPEVRVYRWGDDFLAPPGTTDLRTAPALFVRQWFSHDQLALEGPDYGWDEQFIAAAQAKLAPGAAGVGVTAANGAANSQAREAALLEVVTAVHWKTDGQAPELMVTTFAPDLVVTGGGAGTEGNGVAVEEPLGYATQVMPFICLARERLSRRLEDSRGYGEIAHTWQKQLKTGWDLRSDRNYLTTVPPLFHPPGRRPTKWGPGVRVPRVHQGDYEYADGPNYNVDERALEEAVLRFCDRYFGKSVEMDLAQKTVRKRALAMRWLRGWREVYKRVFQLCQQFLSEETYVRVVGSEQAAPLKVSPEDIRGSYDVQVYFDPDRLDLALMKEKVGMLQLVAGMDGAATMDRAALVRVALNYVDPKLAELLLRSEEAAAQVEVDDEDGVFAKLSAYVDVDVREGQAHGLRLRRLQQLMQNPKVQERLATDEQYRALVEKRAQQLEFQVQQRQNAVIGRLGA